MSELFAGIEAGGTSFRCALARDPETIVVQTELPTTSPEETVANVLAFYANLDDASAAGLATFGPVDIDRESDTFGHILDTPKLAWRDFDIAGALANGLGVPIAIETDVGAAAHAERIAIGSPRVRRVAYVTVGTGIGVGFADVAKDTVPGQHPEVGHIFVPRHHDDHYPGCCPYHQDCLEGLACGPALHERWGQDARTLSSDHPAWDMQAHYLAHLCVVLYRTASPDRIVLGGGVMNQSWLIDRVRRLFVDRLGGYHMKRGADINRLLVRPRLTDSGLIGALHLAQGVSHGQ